MTTLAPVRRSTLSSAQMTTACISAGVAVGAVALMILTAVGRPANLGQKVQSLDGRLQHLQAQAQVAGDAFVYPKGAICSGSPDVAAHRVHADASALASRLKLAAVVSSASVAPVERSLQPLDVSLDGNGDYAAAIATLRGLADLRPVLLIDRIDLLPKGTYLHLHVGGRAYCWSPARL